MRLGDVILLTPLERLMEAPAWAKLFGVMLGAWSYIVGDVFSGILALLVLASAADWYWGRQAARKLSEFDTRMSAWGLQSKVSMVFLLLMVRAFETWLPQVIPWSSKGLIATALCVFAFAQELESIQNHRQELGAGKLPLFDHALDLVKRLAEAILPNKPH